MFTLYGYILRELLKTTLLAVTAMTVLFTMGGGVYNIVRFEGVSADDLLVSAPLIIPIGFTITLPLAAMFAASMVYGRLAADNEINACRAAGVHAHRLFLPAGLLALLVSLIVMALGNLLIPRLVTNITTYLRANIRDIVAQNLQQAGFLRYREKRRGPEAEAGDSFTLTAERVQRVDEAELAARGFDTSEGLQYLHISQPTFLHVDGAGRLIRFAIARQGLCLFNTRADPVTITFFVNDGRDFEIGKHAVYVGQQQIGPVAAPLPAPFQLSFAELRSLLRWYSSPWEVPRLARDLTEFTRIAGVDRTLTTALSLSSRPAGVTLRDGRGDALELRAAGGQRDKDKLELSDVKLSVAAQRDQAPTRYEARAADLRVKPAADGTPQVELTLRPADRQDVLEFVPRDGRYGNPRRRGEVRFEGLRPSGATLREIGAMTAADVVASAGGFTLSAPLEEKRQSLVKLADEWRRKISSTIHVRLALSCCALVTVLMSAVLGVRFRGAHALAAFALSMIPLFAVLLLVLTGRELGEERATALAGPYVIWGGMALVFVADLVLMRLCVRR